MFKGHLFCIWWTEKCVIHLSFHKDTCFGQNLLRKWKCSDAQALTYILHHKEAKRRNYLQVLRVFVSCNFAFNLLLGSMRPLNQSDISLL